MKFDMDFNPIGSKPTQPAKKDIFAASMSRKLHEYEVNHVNNIRQSMMLQAKANANGDEEAFKSEMKIVDDYCNRINK